MFESKLYVKDSGNEHICRNSVDETELLESGWYFKTLEEAKATEVIMDEPEPEPEPEPEKPKTTTRKTNKPSK